MTQTLLFEIGVEEMPSAPLYDAVAQLQTDAECALTEARLSFSSIETFGAPRRLVLRVGELSEYQKERSLKVRGPAVKAAYDSEGNPTKAAEGFARAKGVQIESLVCEADESGEYVYAHIVEPGRSVRDVLPELLARLAEGLVWPKAQRWGNSEARFIRPVRHLVALYGDEVLPVHFAGLVADRVTEGHRFLAPERAIPVASADEYDTAAQTGKFIYDAAVRAQVIRQGIADIENANAVRVVVPEKTFREVVNLVEWPSVALGHFDREFLEVPREVLEMAMTKHQRYFPVENENGGIDNAFIVVHNGDSAYNDRIVAGHERVIRARLADAMFFFREDLKASMEQWVTRLSSITFHEKLGTLGAKVERIEALTGRLALLHGADPAETAIALRAAHLAKADLVSQVVVEFPALQGIMGYHYAKAAGESEEVATAIREHYRPRFAGDDPPSSVPGMLVSAADKLDTMVGIFAIGQGPTGSADPYAVRRGAIGILSMVLDSGLNLTLTAALEAALDGYSSAIPGLDRDAVRTRVAEFITGRLDVMLRDRGHAYDTVAAVLAVASDDPADALMRVCALTEARLRHPDVFENLSTAFIRARNLSRPELGVECDLAFMTAEELALADALHAAENAATSLFESRDYGGYLGVLASLRGPIDIFFDRVLVMDPDEMLRDNRLRLLNRFVAVFLRFADFGLVVG